MRFPFLHAFKEGFPRLVELDQDGVTDFGGQRSVCLMGLQQVKDLDMIEVRSLKNEGLPHKVVGSIVDSWRPKLPDRSAGNRDRVDQ